MIDAAIRQFVSRRAIGRCEYCHLPQAGHDERFSIDHIVPRKHGGDDSASNLALACLRCNLCKGSNLTGIDPSGGQVVMLFNPRRQFWPEHFSFQSSTLVGLTPIGKTTILVLGMNVPERLRLRDALIKEGRLVHD